MEKQVVILGSTGSIGIQSLAVCKALGYRVLAIVANSSVDEMERQIREYRPRFAYLSNDEARADLRNRLVGFPVDIPEDRDAACMLAALPQADVVLNALVGIAGLRPTIAALEAGHDLALANKESLVTGGRLITELAQKKGVHILPVDSEHSAIFQCLGGFEGKCKPKKLILTASGGPFFQKKREELLEIGPAQALRHPNWSMGAKITIDSATLMNKGLEVIEAVWLFGLPAKEIEIVVQRESIIHSAVEFDDYSVIAQLGVPDMKIPIQYALTYPERYPCDVPRLSLTQCGRLTFFEPDMETFECLPACIEAIHRGGLYPALVNGANEQAVALFLQEKIKFLQIGELVRRALNEIPVKQEQYRLEDVFDADRAARAFVQAQALGEQIAQG